MDTNVIQKGLNKMRKLHKRLIAITSCLAIMITSAAAYSTTATMKWGQQGPPSYLHVYTANFKWDGFATTIYAKGWCSGGDYDEMVDTVSQITRNNATSAIVGHALPEKYEYLIPTTGIIASGFVRFDGGDYLQDYTDNCSATLRRTYKIDTETAMLQQKVQKEITTRNSNLMNEWNLDLSNFTSDFILRAVENDESLVDIIMELPIQTGDTVPVIYMNSEHNTAYTVYRDTHGINHLHTFTFNGDNWILEAEQAKQAVSKDNVQALKTQMAKSFLEYQLSLDI